MAVACTSPIEQEEFTEALAGLKTNRGLGTGFWAPREVDQLAPQAREDLLQLLKHMEERNHGQHRHYAT